MTRSLRPLFIFVLALLLVGMQLESQRHALEHVRDSLSHTRDHSLVVPIDEACAICAFFASGANAIAGPADGATIPPATQERPSSTLSSVTPAFRSYYQSRAPPALL